MSCRTDLQLLVTYSEVTVQAESPRATNGDGTEIQPHHMELRATHICVELRAHVPPDDPVCASHGKNLLSLTGWDNSLSPFFSFFMHLVETHTRGQSGHGTKRSRCYFCTLKSWERMAMVNSEQYRAAYTAAYFRFFSWTLHSKACARGGCSKCFSQRHHLSLTCQVLYTWNAILHCYVAFTVCNLWYSLNCKKKVLLCGCMLCVVLCACLFIHTIHTIYYFYHTTCQHVHVSCSSLFSMLMFAKWQNMIETGHNHNRWVTL